MNSRWWMKYIGPTVIMPLLTNQNVDLIMSYATIVSNRIIKDPFYTQGDVNKFNTLVIVRHIFILKILNRNILLSENNIIYIVTSVVMTVLVLIFALLSFIIYRLVFLRNSSHPFNSNCCFQFRLWLLREEKTIWSKR